MVLKEISLGENCYYDGSLVKNLDVVKDSVLNQGWDYIAIVAGIPGAGKSTFAQQVCKYLDSSFNAEERICFTGTGENGLIERTTNAKKGQAFMLDESFESLNSKVTMSSEFVRIINHLQLIRQKGLFIILCLPNFFDLSKGIAIFRASHLFVVYSVNYQRGRFSAFDRDRKKSLYVLGQKFMNYNAYQPNFRGRFIKKWLVNQKAYEKLKAEHLKEQSLVKEKSTKDKMIRDILIKHLKVDLNYPVSKISQISGLPNKTIYNSLERSGAK